MEKLMTTGAVLCAAGAAHGQLTTSAYSAAAGDGAATPAGMVVYDNAYDGMSTFGNAAQFFEPTFAGYEIWLGDDFSTDEAYTGLSISSVGFCGGGCVNPFDVSNFVGVIFDGLPNDPETNVICESVGFEFNGIDTWSATFDDCCLAPGDYMFAFIAHNSFALNGQVYFFQQNGTQDVDNGWHWNPGGAFGFPDDLLYLTAGDGVTPASPNALILASETCEVDECFADCDGNGVLNILDFVCYQVLFQDGDPGADCDGNGELNILDFVCFQGLFNDGC